MNLFVQLLTKDSDASLWTFHSAAWALTFFYWDLWVVFFPTSLFFTHPHPNNNSILSSIKQYCLSPASKRKWDWYFSLALTCPFRSVMCAKDTHIKQHLCNCSLNIHCAPSSLEFKIEPRLSLRDAANCERPGSEFWMTRVEGQCCFSAYGLLRNVV